MKLKIFLAAMLAALLLLSLPLSAAASMHDYEARIVLGKKGYRIAEKYENDSYIMSAGAYTATVPADENGRPVSVTIEYGGSAVYSSTEVSYVGTFPEAVFVHGGGVLKLFANGAAEDALKVDAGLTCIGISDSGGTVYAYFMDAATRDLFVYDLVDGTFTKGNVGGQPVLYKWNTPYSASVNFVRRLGDYISIAREDPATGKQFETLLKQDGDALTIFEPDFSDVPNANPEGKELMPFLIGGDSGYGYLDETGKVAAIYDDATSFFYNEEGAGVAFVTNGGEGCFVDQCLNQVSVTLPSNDAYCYIDGAFEIHYGEENEDSVVYAVELVPKGSEYTDLFDIMKPFAYWPVFG